MGGVWDGIVDVAVSMLGGVKRGGCVVGMGYTNDFVLSK